MPKFVEVASACQQRLVRRKPRKSIHPSIVLAAFCFSLCALLSFIGLLDYTATEIETWFEPHHSTNSLSAPSPLEEDNFQWNKIVPSETLEYTPCFSGFQCARLSVPLNWNTTTEERENSGRAAIAIIKLPAKVPVTDPGYARSIVLNPGGPGESGVYQILTDGKRIQTIVDSAEVPENRTVGVGASAGKYFDILSFDPRGVNNTTPKLRCFPDAFNQQTWSLRFLDYGLLWDSQSIVGMEWARASALGASCSREDGVDGMLKYVNTAQVVEDMVEIIEREGEWRASETKRIVSTQVEAVGKDSKETKGELLERTAYYPGQEKLQYWGMSYGTLIGSTFAAMHPDRVGRIVLDGVVDPADHYSGGWMTQLHDSDKIISKFCEYCFEAGPERCPLYTGSSGSDVEARLTAIMESLKEYQIAVDFSTFSLLPGRRNPGPEVVTYGDVHLYLLSGMYFSFAMAEELFDLLLSIEGRNTTSPELSKVATGKQAILSPEKDECDDPMSDACMPYISMMGSFQSISCMDTGGKSILTRDAFREFLVELRAQGRWISPSWARNKLVCEGFTVQPAWRPELDFKTQQWENTLHPLLIIGNTHDTVTPLRNARRVSEELFPGSVVLQQNSEGHCSHSNPSLCTGKMVREYFQTGMLPGDSTVCEPEMKPFIGCLRDDGCLIQDEDERKFWETMVELADPFRLRGRSEEESSASSWEVSGYTVRSRTHF